MRVLFDVVHPAHVHFYRYVISDLSRSGSAVHVVARDKDVTLDLLDQLQIPYVSYGRAGAKGMSRQAVELTTRDWALLREARSFRPDFILTRNPSGTHVARLVGARSVFDTDDGRAAKLHFWSAAPFAHVITSPASLPENYGRRHRIYPGYKALAFLHPERYQPDASVRDELGVEPGQKFSVVRFAGFRASHDRRESGLSVQAKRQLVTLLSQHGMVFVSSEAPLPRDLEEYRLGLPPHRLVDALAFASVVAGDSQSVALEAGLLGTPSVHCSSWAGRLETMTHLDRTYGLIKTYALASTEEFLTEVETLASSDASERTWQERRKAMLAECVDVSAWYSELLSTLSSD